MLCIDPLSEALVAAWPERLLSKAFCAVSVKSRMIRPPFATNNGSVKLTHAADTALYLELNVCCHFDFRL